MTTATQKPVTTGRRALFAAAGAGALIGLIAAVVGGFVAGSDAAWGAVVGTLMVLVVFGGGALLVDLVAGVLPQASLLIALLTYVLQVVVMALIFLALSRGGALDDALDRRWLGGAVIAGTFAWLVSQIVVSTRLRLPAYELTEPGAR
ncbi:hypothetical protein ACLM5J_16110 [Nocardioides sp. Bht2]|uniref:hypothetical protein n=1 Tax=Nocardioides sp. Bht2 TaxID=3392297 RepID=UPI0039B5708E